MNRGEIVTEVFERGFAMLNVAGTNEVQEITVKAKAGNIKISFDGQTTALIAYNATAAAMQTALEALSNVDAEDIVVTGGPGDEGGTKPYVLTFGGQYEETNVSAVTTDVSGLTEGTKTAAVTTKTAGVGGSRARVRRWVSQAYRAICDHKPWPFLYATKEGEAPLEIEDFGHVQAVVDLTNRNPLEPITLNQVLLGDPKLDGVGNAEYWYTTDGKTISIAPANTSITLKAHYRKAVAELKRDSDEPLFDVAYHDLIVDGAVIKGYKSTDNFEAAAKVLEDYERQLGGMVHALMKPNYDKERRLTRAGRGGDYL